MLFYRVETINNEGPYINTCELKLMDWLEMEGVTDNYGSLYEKYMRDHPSPLGDDRELYNSFYKDHTMINDYIYGFKSLEQLNAWFNLKEEKEYLKHYNFFISTYKIKTLQDSFFSSTFQMVAKKESLNLVMREKIWFYKTW